MPDSLSTILSAAAGPVAIFADFDGTLVDIAETPDAVIIASTLPGQLADLYDALDGALALITGRTISHIDGFLPHQSFSISGSHGAEQRHGGVLRSPDPAHLGDAEKIGTALRGVLGKEPGILIEQKPTGVAVHYRAAPEKMALVQQTVTDVLEAYENFHAIDGKKVVEARPRGTDKGEAIRALMSTPPFAGRTPIFLGDDVTDEDGFAAASDLGGFGIKIGSGESLARFRLPDISQVHAYFDLLIDRYGKPSEASHRTLQGEFAK